MSVFKIDVHSSSEEIEVFHALYLESFENLCIWKGKQIINLTEYIQPLPNYHEFLDYIDFTIRRLGIIIYYTHNDDVITSIALIEVDKGQAKRNPSSHKPLLKAWDHKGTASSLKCSVKVKYLCGNQSTKEDKINGKSQGYYMLDHIFTEYKNNIILIEPATPELIPYYTKYKRPNFPYDKNGLTETFGFLMYGNLHTLGELRIQQSLRPQTPPLNYEHGIIRERRVPLNVP